VQGELELTMAEVTNENDDDVQRDYTNEARYIRSLMEQPK